VHTGQESGWGPTDCLDAPSSVQVSILTELPRLKRTASEFVVAVSDLRGFVSRCVGIRMDRRTLHCSYRWTGHVARIFKAAVDWTTLSVT
jgi:hypothetical protein